MRILHVIPSVGPLRGGPSIALGLMTRALRDAGVAIDVATTNDNDTELLHVPIGAPVDEGGVRYWYFERTAQPYTTSTGLARWLRAHARDYHVVHTHALFSFATAVAAMAARRSRVPYIVRPLGTLAAYGLEQHALLKRASWLMLERRLLRHAAGVHFTSIAEKLEAERLGEWRSFVVPLGVGPFAGQTAAAAAGDRLNYLYLGRVHPKKRIELLLCAFVQVKTRVPHATLTIAGSGDPAYVRALQELSAEQGLTPAVRWAGHVSGADKVRLLEASTAFVLPSVNENFGIAVVEALSAGVPVVVTRGVAIYREVEAHGAGVIVDDDATSLAAGMLYLRPGAPRINMAQRALSLAQQKFSMTGMQQGLLAMYQRVSAQ